MPPKATNFSRTHELFRLELINIIDQGHAIAKLTEQINWQAAIDKFGLLYTSDNGRPGISIRLMVGLHYLKHTFNVSDEMVVAQWVENPYWQYFCGEQYFQHQVPINASMMTRFRNRIGKEGCEFMLGLTIETGLATKTITPRSLAVVNVDTTVQEKAVSFPLDAKLYHKARRALVRLAKRQGIALRQSYERTGAHALAMNGRYAHARQMKRAKREQKKLRTQLGSVIRDIERKLALQSTQANAVQTAEPSKALSKLLSLLDIAKRIHAQQRQRSAGEPTKIYSVHAPEVECIAKGKAHKRYEFGAKVSVTTTSKDNFVVGMNSLPGNPYDGHTLASALLQVHTLSGVLPKEAYVDKGYRGHGVKEVAVWIAGVKKDVTAAIKKKLKRRNAVEPSIGHMKSDGRLARNFLKGEVGDAMNAILCGAGHNLRKILKRLALCWLKMLQLFYRVSLFDIQTPLLA